MRRAAIAVVVAVLAVLSAAPALAGASGTAAAPRQGLDIDVRRDLTYRHVGGDDLKLDAYIPAAGGVRPGVMVIYGGGWILGSKEQSEPLARALAKQGYIAFAMNYRLAPFHPFPAAVDDVQASVAWVRDHAFDFGLDPGRIGAVGGSAGGHLAAMLATLGEGPHDRGSRIGAAVSWAGPMDLHPSEFGPESQIYLDAFLDCIGRPCDEATIVAASPISHVDPSDAPILLANGTADLLVPPDQALRMADALERAGVGHELAIIPDAGHDERVVVPVEQRSFQFLRRELGDVEPGTPGSVGVGGGSGGGLLAPVIVIAVAALAVGALLVASRSRRRVRY
ncbi:MAG TPA: alpha/beta hydrolase [Acidimicrobiia bacterium]|nr:alpha/beta hydrolase [Acidimicrobiia bacterium]